MIKKVGNKWCLYSKDGSKKLFCHTSKDRVMQRERFIQRVQHMQASAADDENTSVKLSILPIPVMPLSPTKTINNQDLTQSMIDGTLNYDPKFRTALLYLVKDEKDDAHRRKGLGNKAVIGTFSKKPYAKDGHVYIDAEIQKLTLDEEKQKQFEAEIMLMVSEQGAYPERSVDLIHKNKLPDAPNEWNFEGLALCGTDRAAMPNLPKLKFEELLEINGLQSYTINFSKENKEMGLEEKDVQALLEKERKTTQEAIAAAVKAAVEENTKALEVKFSQETEQIKKKVDASKQNQIDAWAASQAVTEKVPSTMIDNVKNIRLGLSELDKSKVSFSVSVDNTVEKKEMTLEEAFVKFIEGLTPLAKFSKMSKDEDLQSTLTGEKKIVVKEGGEIKLRGEDDSEKRLNLFKDVAAQMKIVDAFTNPSSWKKVEAEMISMAQASEDKELQLLFGSSELGKKN